MHLKSYFSIGVAIALSACTPTTTTPTPSASFSSSSSSAAEVSSIEVIADNLRIPWGVDFLPGGDILVTERPGTLLRIGNDKKKYEIEGVKHRGEGGLMGVAVHPQFVSNHWIYLAFTTTEDTNRVVRFTLENDELKDEKIILDNIPAGIYHDGGRLAFGARDGYLYITTGDSTNERLAQETASLAGKILRVDSEGGIPPDNPFGTAVYSSGHRNPQGLAWDDAGQLWSTEHGRSGVSSGYDELNKIQKGGNYGWPTYQGDQAGNDTIAPALHSGPSTTWAPASAAYLDGSIFFGGLKGEALYEAVLSDAGTPTLKTHLLREYGRIRTVAVGPDGMLYITTSNTDGRGSPKASDDKLIRIDPKSLK